MGTSGFVAAVVVAGLVLSGCDRGVEYPKTGPRPAASSPTPTTEIPTVTEVPPGLPVGEIPHVPTPTRVIPIPRTAGKPVAGIPRAGSSRGTAGPWANCTEVRNAGRAPIFSWEDGFQSKFDSDGDGIGCEPDSRASSATTSPARTTPPRTLTPKPEPPASASQKKPREAPPSTITASEPPPDAPAPPT